MACDTMDNEELVTRVVKLRRQLHHLDQRHLETEQRRKVPMGEAQEGQLELTKEEISLERRRDELWEQQQHFLNEVRRRSLDEILDKAVQADDAQWKQERHDD